MSYEPQAWRFYRVVPPTAAETHWMNETFDLVRSLGVEFAPKTVAVFFVHREDLGTLQGVTYFTPRPIRVYVRPGLTPDDLVGCLSHELHHAADALRHPDMPLGEHEERAHAFGQRALSAWRSRQARR